MKVAIVGANTNTGRKLVLKAEENGISTVLCVKDFNNILGDGRIVIKDYKDLLAGDLSDCHYVIDTESFFNISNYDFDELPLWHLSDILKGSKTKLLCFGSSAFLYTSSDRRSLVANTDSLELDEQEQREERLCIRAYRKLKECTDVDWSVLCPPLLLDMHAYGSGKFEFSDDILPVGINGDSSITIHDFISATVELLKQVPKTHSLTSVRGIR